MGILDTFKKRKEKDNRSLDEILRDGLKSNSTFDYVNEPDNKELAKQTARENKMDEQKALKILDSFEENKWWFSLDPEELALQQLKLGKDLLVIDETILRNCVYLITGKLMLPEKIKENWDSLYKEVQKIVGEEKVKNILYTKEDWEREYEEACKIDLG